MKYLKHDDLVEYRQRISRVQTAQGKFQEEQILFQRWVNGIGSAYGMSGLQYQIDPNSGEFMVPPEKVHYDLVTSVNLVATQDFGITASETIPLREAFAAMYAEQEAQKKEEQTDGGSTSQEDPRD